jgi:protein SCO1/2
MLRVLVIALVMLVAVMMLLPRDRDLTPTLVAATVLDTPRVLPAVALIDQNGERFAIDDLAGQPIFVFFGFTHCPDICPLTLAVLREALQTLREEASAPAVLFVSVDPGRDTPERIKAYLAGFDAGFFGATADDAALAPLYAALGVSVHQEREGDAVVNVVHNGTVYLLDSASRWTAIFGGSAHRAEDIVTDYRALRTELTRG